MDRDSARRWVEGRRVAAQREALEDRRAGPRPRWAITNALALVALTGLLHGWPPPETEVDQREDEIVHERWARLRRRLRPDVVPR